MKSLRLVLQLLGALFLVMLSYVPFLDGGSEPEYVGAIDFSVGELPAGYEEVAKDIPFNELGESLKIELLEGFPEIERELATYRVSAWKDGDISSFILYKDVNPTLYPTKPEPMFVAATFAPLTSHNNGLDHNAVIVTAANDSKIVQTATKNLPTTRQALAVSILKEVSAPWAGLAFV